MSRLNPLLALALTVGASGCSMLFVDAPPANHAEKRTLDCTPGRAAPITDTVLASLSALLLPSALGEDGGPRMSAVVFDSALVVGFGASAIRGFTATAECRRAKGALERRLRDDEMAALRSPRLFGPPQPYPPPSQSTAGEPGLSAPAHPEASPSSGRDPWLSAGPAPGFAPPPPPEGAAPPASPGTSGSDDGGRRP